MECDVARESISATIDHGGELSAATLQHVAGCRECREWQEQAHRLRRQTIRVAASPTSGLQVAQLPARFRLHRWLRWVLAWAGALLIIWNVVDMFAPGSGSAIHLERHQAAFGVALGLAFLYVAWRPDRAYGMVPFAATFTFALSVSAAIDLVNGASTFVRESAHLVELIGLGVLWVLGAAAGPGKKTRSNSSS